ncbi:MAG: tetratricopeptide repeat protein [Rhodospirillales bacterium]|nr:tetratricopeptide repeat protein [Rhodospirillales bacterium]
MAEQPELILQPETDALTGVDGMSLPDLGAADLSDKDGAVDSVLDLEAPGPDIQAEPQLQPDAPVPEMEMDPQPAASGEMAPLTEAIPLDPAPLEKILAVPEAAPVAAPAAPPAAPPPPVQSAPAADMAPPPASDATPDVLEAFGQVLRAFDGLFDALPDWAGMFLAAFLAAAMGILIGWRISRRGIPNTAETATMEPAPTVRAALPPPENPAFKNYQIFLEGKGVSAKERDAQMRAFSERYREMRQNLRDLNPGNTELEDQVELVRDALDAGDFDRVYALLTRIGNRENTDGTEKRIAALKHLMAAAVAKSVAGDLQMSRLDYESAADNFRQAVEALPPFQDDLHAEYLNKYGTASYQAGHHATAIAAFERALQILEKRLGKNHPDVATALNNLALLHYSRGNYDAAEPLYKRSLAIDEQTLGIDHTGVATDLNNLALLYKKKGNLEEAEPLLRRAMEIKEKNFDPGHPSLVTGLRNYASLLRSLGREEEADVYERRATVLPPSRTGVAAE